MTGVEEGLRYILQPWRDVKISCNSPPPDIDTCNAGYEKITDLSSESVDTAATAEEVAHVLCSTSGTTRKKTPPSTSLTD